jgi:hypothetical protein
MNLVHRAHMTVAESDVRCSQFFCILTLLLKNIYVWTSRNFICKFGPDARRHSLWRRGNTARRHSLWRRCMTWQQWLPTPRADLSSMWQRRGLVARRHTSWRRATDSYKTVALLAESSTEREMCPWAISKYFGD